MGSEMCIRDSHQYEPSSHQWTMFPYLSGSDGSQSAVCCAVCVAATAASTVALIAVSASTVASMESFITESDIISSTLGLSEYEF